jgi:DNA replication licensing factor MCM4
MAYDDNVDNVKPGDRVTVIGVYRAQGIRQVRHQRVLKSVYTTYLDVISYDTLKNTQQHTEVFTEEIRAKIKKLSQEPKITEKLCRSLAPSIYELDDVKLGILC